MVNVENYFLAFRAARAYCDFASVEALQNRTRLRGSTARVHHWRTKNGEAPAREGFSLAGDYLVRR